MEPAPSSVAEIGTVIRAYRKASGLSQKELARMGGVSRATLNYLESGRDIEIGASRLLALLSVLGVPFRVPAGVDAAHDDAVVERAGKRIVGKGRRQLARHVVTEALLSGKVPDGYQGQIIEFLESAPEEVVLAAVRSAAARSGQGPRAIWKNARTLAKTVGSNRPIWSKGPDKED